MSSEPSHAVRALGEAVRLPSGITLPNRIVKAAMEEGMATLGGGPPNETHFALYNEWARGSYGLVITGNVAVSSDHYAAPFDIVVYDDTTDEHRARWRTYAHVCKAHGTPTVVQLVHAGRQSMRGEGRPLWVAPLAPSAVQLEAGSGPVARLMSRLVFARPRAMTHEQIVRVQRQFLQAAVLCKASGFDGIQLHCAHGYLLAQFLSPKTNRRDDGYGGSARNRMRFVLELIDMIREECPRPFTVGVKLNSADYVAGGLTEDEALQHVQWLQETGKIDFIEVSGGSYEDGGFMQDEGANYKRANKREAFFAAFAARARDAVRNVSSADDTPAAIMVTGGLRSRTGMAAAVTDGAADLLGLARPSAVAPQLPLLLLDPRVPDDQAHAPAYKIQGTHLWRKLMPVQAAGAGFSFIWHCCQMRRISAGKQADLELGFFGALAGAFAQALPALWAALLPVPFLLLATAGWALLARTP